MKIDNPPLPPFSKGGEGGFETYFLNEPNSRFQTESFGSFEIKIWKLFGI